MIHSIEPFEEPVNAIKSILGPSYEKEHTALSSLCGLVKTHHPKKIVKVGGANSSTTAAMLCCLDVLKIPSQVYVVDACNTVPPYTKDVFDLKRELKQRDSECYHVFREHTLAAYMDEIGDGVDLLILDAAEAMPYDILDFIVAFPHLTPNAVVVVCEAVPANSSNNVLIRSVTTDKLSAHSSPCMDLQDCIQFITTRTISIFQVNSSTVDHIVDLFVALKCPWRYTIDLSDLLEYENFIETHYDSVCLKLYKQATIEADPYKKMLEVLAQSLLKTFPQVLLYGKGKRGKYFLKLANFIGIPVGGFIVSDGRDTIREYENLPVYAYSQIPFLPNDIFIFQTAASQEVHEQLCKSEYHWMDLPESFWDAFVYEEYLLTMIPYMEKAMKIEGKGHVIWAKGGLTI